MIFAISFLFLGAWIIGSILIGIAFIPIREISNLKLVFKFLLLPLVILDYVTSINLDPVLYEKQPEE